MTNKTCVEGSACIDTGDLMDTCNCRRCQIMRGELIQDDGGVQYERRDFVTHELYVYPSRQRARRRFSRFAPTVYVAPTEGEEEKKEDQDDEETDHVLMISVAHCLPTRRKTYNDILLLNETNPYMLLQGIRDGTEVVICDSGARGVVCPSG